MPKRDPTFSVVMPAYNAARTIRAAISSVFAQTSQDFEVIVIDDESEDETLKVVQQFSDARIRILSRAHSGLPATRNAGIAIARGKYVSFLDSDDLWLPGYLNTMGTALTGRPETALAYGDAWVMDDETRRIARTTAMAERDPPIPPPHEPYEFLARLLCGNFVFVSATVRRSVLVSVGGFDETLARAEDYDLWLRLAARGYRAVRPPGLHAVYRRRRGSLSTDAELMRAERIRIYGKLASDETLPPELRTLAADQASAVTAELERRHGIRGKIALMRGRVGELKTKIFWSRYWYASAPEDVSAVFPDLHRV